MDERQLQQLILYIVSQVDDFGGYVTTIRLVKFLYLIDLEHYRRYGRILTGLDWQFYHYGPYAFTLPQIGASIGYRLDREEFESAGKQGVRFRPTEEYPFPRSLGIHVKNLVDLVLEVWAEQETSILLDYVYRRTEPMEDAVRGQSLDFLKVQRGTRYYNLVVRVDDNLSKKLRNGIRTLDVAREERMVDFGTINDQVYEKGIQALQEDEGEKFDLDGKTLRFTDQQNSLYLED